MKKGKRSRVIHHHQLDCQLILDDGRAAELSLEKATAGQPELGAICETTRRPTIATVLCLSAAAAVSKSTIHPPTQFAAVVVCNRIVRSSASTCVCSAQGGEQQQR